jgi:hypothetical protein
MSSDALSGLTPVEEATGVKGDFSLLLKFHQWEPVLHQAKGGFPTNSCEKAGTWCGIAEDQGNTLTRLVLTDGAQEVIACFNARSANNPDHPSLCIARGFGDDTEKGAPNPTLFSSSDLTGLDSDPPNLKLPHFSPDQLLGLTFLWSQVLSFSCTKDQR